MATPIPDNAARFSHEEIVAATAARAAAVGAGVTGVVLDSRRAAAGNLFVALRGETHDAHEFVPQAVANGASAVIVEREVDADADVYRVDDTLAALGALASLHRARSGAEVVAITGSVGKTTTKELTLAALTAAGRRVHATAGNLNNRVGVPMTLFGITEAHDTAVVEVGMSVPGEIATLAEMVRPDVGVVTSVAAVHTEGVGGVEGVAREKGALLLALGAGATAVWCCDEARLAPYAERSPAARRLGYGRAASADLRLTRCAEGARTRYAVEVEGATHAAELSLIGEAAAMNATGAAAVTWALAPESLPVALEAMSRVAPRPQRMFPIALSDGALILDDTYNASERSTLAALRTGARLADARGGALIAVLGDMLELGAEEVRQHESVGAEAARLGARALFVHGERMAHAVRAAMMQATALGQKTPVRVCFDVADIAPQVREAAGPADVIVVKGSRGMRMERVVDALREEAR